MTLHDLLNSGFPEAPHLNRLRQKLLNNMAAKGDETGAVGIILQEAQLRGPGLVFRDIYDEEEHNTGRRKPLIEVDRDIRTYYGYVEPAMQELYAMGLHRPFGERWIDDFLKDHAVYRVTVVCCMCVAGAVLISGVDSRIGNPTRQALSMAFSGEPEDTTTETIRVATSFVGTPSLKLSVDVEVTK